MLFGIKFYAAMIDLYGLYFKLLHGNDIGKFRYQKSELYL
jgi:hypothetical protein